MLHEAKVEETMNVSFSYHNFGFAEMHWTSAAQMFVNCSTYQSSVLAGFVLDGVRLSVEQGHFILCSYMFLLANNADMLDVVLFVNFVIFVLYSWTTRKL